MKKRVLILVGIPNFDYSNENSAVLLFLRTIKKSFETAGYTAEFPFQVEKLTNKSTGITTNGITSKIKGLVKKWNWLYHSLAYRNYSKNQESLLNQLKQKAPFDLVVEFHTVGSIIGKALAEVWNCPFSVVFDSPVDQQYVDMHGTKTVYWNAIKASEQLTLESADKIMVYSPACSDFISEKYRINGAIGILPCIVEKPFTDNEPEADVFKLLFIGSFLKWHKVELLVEVFSEFIKDNPTAKLQLIGFGEEWQKVKSLVEALKIQDAVEMPGFVSNEELLEYKRRASIGIMPGSNWYGSPLKLFEYAQSGIPFIAPDSKTVRSIFIENEHCLYVDSQNEKASLLKGIQNLFENDTLRAELASAAKEFVQENYQGEIYLNKLESSLSL